MKKLLILLTAFSLTATVHAENADDTAAMCKENGKQVKADYTIKTTTHNATGVHAHNSIRESNLSLWRVDNKVAHQYPSTQITEVYTLVRNKLIKPVRYFDGHQRAIEYQPGETIHGKKETDFSYRYQLISDTFIDTMTLVSSEGRHCNQKDTYELKTATGVFSLVWLPQQRLIERFNIEQGNMHRTWTLTNADYEADVSTFFAKRIDYQSTDYADIGDDHTDPFLTKMVTQGFIEAGASGFYDQHGRALQGEHNH
ncbi:hypothetical protein [Alteromonas genovensis]|uniref:hypothetical protein n=1 Tax=Alteromonas genovensis TaxID=471225 RepID=UPI002FE05420